MRRLYGSLGMILLIFALMLWHIQVVERQSSSLVAALESAEQAVAEGRAAEGLRLTEQAQAQWKDSERWLGMLLRMGDTDEVDDGFQEVLNALRDGKLSDYRRASAALQESVRYLAEVEQVNLANIF